MNRDFDHRFWDSGFKSDKSISKSIGADDNIRAGRDYVEWVDAIGWPQEQAADPSKLDWIRLYIAVRIDATGTDGKTVTAMFTVQQFATSLNNQWKLEEGHPRTNPKLKHTWT